MLYKAKCNSFNARVQHCIYFQLGMGDWEVGRWNKVNRKRKHTNDSKKTIKVENFLAKVIRRKIHNSFRKFMLAIYYSLRSSSIFTSHNLSAANFSRFPVFRFYNDGTLWFIISNFSSSPTLPEHWNCHMKILLLTR